jgi:hypothetical protein
MHAQGMLEPHEVEALCSQLHQLVPIDLSPQEMASVRRTETKLFLALCFFWLDAIFR